MKKKILKIFGFSILAIGIIVCLYAVGTRLYSNHERDKLNRQYEEFVQEIENNTPGTGNPSDEEEINLEDYDFPDGVIAMIEIPKIEVNSPIKTGGDTSEALMDADKMQALLKGSIAHTGTLPGRDGNCCLYGHRSYTYGQDFNRLEEIGEGDDIYIKFINKKYHYVVDSTTVVVPEDTSVVENTPGEKNITLITCTPPRISTHRFIVRGHLVSEEPNIVNN